MYDLMKKFSGRSLMYVMMVAPAAIYTNLNAATITYTDGMSAQTMQSVQANSSAWVTQQGLHPNADTLINAIANSELHGLNPNAYQLASLEQELESFVTNSEHSDGNRSDALIQQQSALEKSLNKAFVHFARDLGQGILDAQKTQKNLHRAQPSVNTDNLLIELKNGRSTVRELLAELQPSTPYYAKLKNKMQALLEERDTGVIRTKVQYLESVKPGSAHALVIDLRSRLQETGDLDPSIPLGINYDYAVEQAIVAVQQRHGITDDGVLNEKTVAALNATVDDDITEVAMNLERWRWMPRELGERHIMVNIPSYQLSLMNGEQQVTEMAVVVGSKKHKTPVFSKDAKFVEVAPTWTVPASITNNEIIPMELRKPGYIDRERMDYYKWINHKLVRVPRSQISASDFHKKPFPYVLRQRAGKDNALGGIKVLMPNKHAVYMHDTQAKSLFAKTDRAYSHGCIRLSAPFVLGGLLLQLDGKTQEETNELLAKKKTTRVQLQDTTPTHITYFTAWVDDDGKLNKRKDVYSLNKAIISGLQSKKSLLSTLGSRTSTILAEQNEL